MTYKRNLREIERDGNFPARVVGLTGGIGSGKTVATDALRAAGYSVIDADEISRDVFAKDTDGERELIGLFPQAEKNGHLDRARLRALIASDAQLRFKLNAFSHPRIIAEIALRLNAAVPPVVLSAPLLFESALARLCDKTVCVYCPRALRIQRICTRDGVSAHDAERIIDAQIPDAERCTLADFIVPSDVPRELFVEEIIELFDAITKR